MIPYSNPYKRELTEIEGLHLENETGLRWFNVLHVYEKRTRKVHARCDLLYDGHVQEATIKTEDERIYEAADLAENESDFRWII